MSFVGGLRPGQRCSTLDALDWQRDAWDALEHCSQLLTEVSAHSLAEHLCGLELREREQLNALSVERPSHYKWLLAGPTRDYVVWLHEYRTRKPEAETGLGTFAQSIHDHRYSFTSRVLRGALDVVNVEGFEDATTEGGYKTTEKRILAPEVYKLHSKTFHRVAGWQLGTVTMVIQGPIEKHSSRVLTGTQTEIVPDFWDRLPRFAGTLAQSDTFS